jgi:hypothetical protein
MTYTKEQLNEFYRKLPPELQDAMGSMDNADANWNIGQKFKLHIDKIGELGYETGLVMLGLTKPQDFVGNLEKSLGVDKVTAAAIAKEVNEQIFLPIRDSLKKIHHMGTETEESIEPMKPLKPESEEPNKADVLQAIEQPETIPMTVRTTSAVPPIPKPAENKPITLPLKTETTTPSGTISSLPQSEVFKIPEVSVDGSTLSKNSGQATSPQAKPVIDPYKEAIK